MDLAARGEKRGGAEVPDSFETTAVVGWGAVGEEMGVYEKADFEGNAEEGGDRGGLLHFSRDEYIFLGTLKRDC